MAKRKHRRPEQPVTRRELLRALDRLKQDLLSAIVHAMPEPEPAHESRPAPTRVDLGAVFTRLEEEEAA